MAFVRARPESVAVVPPAVGLRLQQRVEFGGGNVGRFHGADSLRAWMKAAPSYTDGRSRTQGSLRELYAGVHSDASYFWKRRRMILASSVASVRGEGAFRTCRTTSGHRFPGARAFSQKTRNSQIAGNSAGSRGPRGGAESR
jgi:hypothetical protein